MAKFLTFDLGTTLLKVALFDDAGRLLGVERVAPPIERPRPGWVELNPDKFLAVLIDAAAKLKSATGDWNDVAAVTFATQANSFTFFNSSWDATLKLILWPDERAASLAGELAEIASWPGFRQSTGMPRFGPALALAKVAWLKRHHPKELWDAEQLCFISDYLGEYISAKAETEAGVAGLSGALDITTLQWRRDVLERLDVPPIKMLPVSRAGTDLGLLRGKFDEFGLPPTCRFVVGCLDQYAGAIGTGTIEPAQVCETTGTVLAAVRCSDRIDMTRPDDVYHGPAFDEGKFFQMSFSSTAANLLEWYRNSLPDRPSFEELSQLATGADDAVVIEAYRDGEPIESCFRNVRPGHSVGQVVRGIMRCVAEALKWQVLSLAPQMPQTIRSAGGAARSDIWLQIKADVLGTTIEAIDCPEPTSMGAAMLAARAVTGRSMQELAKDWVRVRKAFTPLARD